MIASRPINADIVEHDLLHLAWMMSKAFSLPDPFLSASNWDLASCFRVGRQFLEISPFRILGSFEPGVLAKDHQVEQGIASQAVAAMHRNAGTLARRIQARERPCSCSSITTSPNLFVGMPPIV